MAVICGRTSEREPVWELKSPSIACINTRDSWRAAILCSAPTARSASLIGARLIIIGAMLAVVWDATYNGVKNCMLLLLAFDY